VRKKERRGERERRDDSPSRNDPSRLRIHSKRSNEIGVTCEGSETLSGGGGPDFHTVDERKRKEVEVSVLVSFVSFPSLVGEAERKKDSRSIVTPTNDVILLEIHTSQSSLMSFHRPHALSRNDIPDLDLPIS